MNVLDRITSALRFLTRDQQEQFAPCRSEARVAELIRILGVKFP